MRIVDSSIKTVLVSLNTEIYNKSSLFAQSALPDQHVEGQPLARYHYLTIVVELSSKTKTVDQPLLADDGKLVS